MDLFEQFLFEFVSQLFLPQPFDCSVRLSLSVGHVLHILFLMDLDQLLFTLHSLFFDGLLKTLDVLESNFGVNGLLGDDLAVQYFEYFMRIKLEVDIMCNHD